MDDMLKKLGKFGFIHCSLGEFRRVKASDFCAGGT